MTPRRPAKVLAAVLAAGLSASCAASTAPLLLGVGAPTAGADASPPATRPTTTATPPAGTATAAGPVGSAVKALADLVVKGRAPDTGYSRAQFGPAWQDTDRNGCDTRDDILARDLTHVTYRLNTHNCVAITGTLLDPYTGQVITFVKARAAAVQIDHVVALSNAWQTGAFRWPDAKRLAFANDPLNLLAVDGPTNEAKGDGDAATWLPPLKTYRCAYVARQIAVKAKYELWVTPAEHNAAATVLTKCAGQPAPAGGNPTLAPDNSTGP